MEIEKLKQLIAFEEYNTLSAASEVLHISQPTLTRAMQNIENELGVRLFERTKNSMHLSDTGKYAVEKAKILIAQHDDMVNQIRAFDESRRTISIGSVAPGPLWTILPQLIDRFPGKMIRSDINSAEILIDGLRNGIFDEIILTEDFSDFIALQKANISVKEWGDEYLYAALPKHHRLADRQVIKWKDIDGDSVVIFSETGMWGDVHRRSMPNSKIIVQSDRVLLEEIVNSSSLISFMSNLSMEHFSKPKGRAFVRIDEENARVRYYIHSIKK